MKTVYVLICIPKSGSRSIENMFRNNFPESHIFGIPPLDINHLGPEGLTDAFRRKRKLFKWGFRMHGVFTEKAMWAAIDRKTGNGDVVSGHFAYDRAVLPSNDTRFITIMRNPVQRLISEYNYSRGEYLDRPAIRRVYMKGLVEVAGTKTFSDFLEYMFERKERYSNPASTYITGSQQCPDPFSFLKEHYFHFGLLERMDLFSAQLSNKLGINIPEEWKNKTRNKADIKLSDKDMERTNSLLGKDIELYERVRSYILDSEE